MKVTGPSAPLRRTRRESQSDSVTVATTDRAPAASRVSRSSTGALASSADQRQPISVSRSASADQLADHLPIGADGDRSAGAVAEGGFGIDAELMIEGDHQVLRSDGPFLGDLALGVGCSDDPTADQAAAGGEDRHDVAPMVA